MSLHYLVKFKIFLVWCHWAVRKKLQNFCHLNSGLHVRQIWFQLIIACGKYCKRRCTKHAKHLSTTPLMTVCRNDDQISDECFCNLLLQYFPRDLDLELVRELHMTWKKYISILCCLSVFVREFEAETGQKNEQTDGQASRNTQHCEILPRRSHCYGVFCPLLSVAWSNLLCGHHLQRRLTVSYALILCFCVCMFCVLYMVCSF